VWGTTYQTKDSGKRDYPRSQAEEVQKERLRQFEGETADFRIKHGFKVCGIPAFPNRLQPLAYPPE